MRKVELFDTTLRDGAQTEGISYSVNDKIKIVKKLDEIGIHYIEGGWPGSNPKDKEFFSKLKKSRLKNAELVAFGSTRRADKSASSDANLKSLLDAGTEVITIFGKSWDLHVRDVLRVPLAENLKMISDSVKFLVSRKRKVIYDAEHFFDAYKNNAKYSIQTLLAAQNSGASIIILCDTNGGTIPSDLVKIIKKVKQRIKVPIGIHAHNDLGLAVANSIAAVEAGCVQVHGTVNGYGERCGNADLFSVIGILKLKLGVGCVSDKNLKELTEASRFIAEISNMKQRDNQPLVGNSAFAHKGGVHINAVMKNPQTYEHIDPVLVGNCRRVLVSELAGKTPILLRAKKLKIPLDEKAPKTKKVIKMLQDLEYQGLQFEAADASFELLLKKALKKYKNFFELEGFRVIVEKSLNKRISSKAIIRLKVDNVARYTSAEGDGPVNALDSALRKALQKSYPILAKMHLSDFKVRVLDEKAGTAAKVRVLIQSQDEKDSWTTVGVSENIIEASWQALVDSVEYKLLKDKNKD